MRAVLLTDIDTNHSEFTIEGNNAHHLMKVIRIKPKEKLLILDGKGSLIYTTVKNISKKDLTVSVQEIKVAKKLASSKIDVGICLPKKEAFFEMIRQATELGVSKIIPIRSTYSQINYDPSDKLGLKVQKIIESGMIQSNNPYFLEVENQRSILNINELIEKYEKTFYLCSHQVENINNNLLALPSDNSDNSVLLLLGPEAGLSSDEEKIIFSNKKVCSIHLPTPILRAPTALSCAVGYILR